jgi:hypothetical protein
MKKDINPKFWDVNVGKVTGRTSEANEINTLLDNAKSAIYKVYRDILEKGNDVSAEKETDFSSKTSYIRDFDFK